MRISERPSVAITYSPVILALFMAYSATPEEQARKKLKKILKNTEQVDPKDKPDKVPGSKGKKTLFFSHRCKPDIVYMGTESEGIRDIIGVAIYRNGRPKYYH